MAIEVSNCRWRNRLVGFIQAACVFARTSHGAASKASAKGVKKRPSQAVRSLRYRQYITVTVMGIAAEFAALELDRSNSVRSPGWATTESQQLSC